MDAFIDFCVANHESLLWLLATIVLLIIEAATVQLVSIWLAIGSFVTVFAAVLGAPLLLQFVIFVAVSAICLVFTRKFVKKALHIRKTPTNADSAIGQCGPVLEEINNLVQTGRVRINNLDWTARSADNTIIPAGQIIRVDEIDGVKLIVSLPVQTPCTTTSTKV